MGSGIIIISSKKGDIFNEDILEKVKAGPEFTGLSVARIRQTQENKSNKRSMDSFCGKVVKVLVMRS